MASLSGKHPDLPQWSNFQLQECKTILNFSTMIKIFNNNLMVHEYVTMFFFIEKRTFSKSTTSILIQEIKVNLSERGLFKGPVDPYTIFILTTSSCVLGFSSSSFKDTVRSS